MFPLQTSPPKKNRPAYHCSSFDIFTSFRNPIIGPYPWSAISFLPVGQNCTEISFISSYWHTIYCTTIIVSLANRPAIERENAQVSCVCPTLRFGSFCHGFVLPLVFRKRNANKKRPFDNDFEKSNEPACV